jgi:8-oxo-dGTP pyrophosphatase MutT (NUDIX family)
MKSPHTRAAVREAAAIILLREGRTGLEALLLRRPASMGFAGGQWVFPGGVIEPADCGPEIRQHFPTDSLTLGTKPAPAAGEPRETCGQGPYLGACRETFEEAGILLARHRDGSPCDGALVHALQSNRSAMSRTPDAFAHLLADHDLVLELDRLILWERWVTPSGVARRFDTWFFLAAMPGEQQVQPALHEAEESCWLTLDGAVGIRDVAPPIRTPPTLFQLQELAARYAKCRRLDVLLERSRSERPPKIMAKMVRTNERIVTLLPWDPEYAGAPGEGVSCDDDLRSRFADYPSRLELDPATRLPR